MLKKAAAVVTCDAEGTVFTDADVLVEDGRIAEIGRELKDRSGFPTDEGDAFEVIDCRGKILYPGLVNTHHHFFQTFVRNLIKVDFVNLSLMDWLDTIYRIFAHIDSDAIYYSSVTAMADLLKHGCTTAFDHSYCHTARTGFGGAQGSSSVDRQMEAASLLGLRFYAGRGCNTLPRSEGSTIPDEMCETTDGFIADCERLIKTYHGGDTGKTGGPMTGIVVAPCQPVNCYEDTFIESAALARQYGVRLHTHMSEGENDVMMARWGCRTLDWAEKRGFVGNDVWYAHGWDFTPEELKRLGKTGTGVSHCPTPAALCGAPILDISAMISFGVPVSLGCDGAATNDSSNLLDALRIAYMLQCLHSRERGGAIPSPYELLKAVTVTGAATLGRNDLGILAAGKGADLFAVDAGRIEFAGTLHDPKNLLPRCAVTGPVWLTMVGGKVVWKNGEFPGLDEAQLLAQAESHCTKVLRDKFRNIYY